MKLDDDRLIYLDLEFISRKYEEIFETDPNTRFTKQQSGKAEIGALFATAGVNTQESRSYSLTSRQMLHKLWDELKKRYGKLESFENYQGTQIGWIKGDLTLGEWSTRGSDEPGYEFYQLIQNDERTAFLTELGYFSAGFANIFGASSALKGNISIPVKCLIRVMWHVEDARNYVACPYVIIENS
ncbi:hypothetical protein [Haliea sp. E17]|uniref:hypothetical protein n=1 Tax=Haliea sp. E17 TaxID=3401576 RepID=UPI003AB05222